MAFRRKLTPKEFDRKAQEILLRMQGAAKPFPDDSEEAKKKRRERGLKDHFWFFHMYLPHYFTKPFGKFHQDLIDALETRGKSLSAMAFPREHGKSAICSFAYEIHQACYRRRHYMITVSDTSDLAAEFIQWIKLEFEENPRIRQDFGDLVTPGYWTDEDLVVGGKVRIRGMSAGQRIRGTRFMQYRPDLIIPDDMENDINVRNKKLVKDRFKWLLSAAYGSLDRDGTMLMIGTIIERVSVLGMLINHIRESADIFQKEYGIKRMSAEIYGARLPDGTPLWPENYTDEELRQIELTVGLVVWASDWMNNPIDQGIIKLDWIKYYRPEELTGREIVKFTGVDPSARQGENNDYKAIITIGKDTQTKNLYVIDAWIKHESIPEMNRAFISRYKQYRMALSGFETNGYQLVVKEDLDKRCQAEGLYPGILCIEHHSDKVLRMSREGPLIERGVILFQRGQGDQDILIEQLCAIGTSEKDDGPDAMEIAISVAEHGAGEFEYKTSGRSRIGARAHQEGYFA